MPSCEKCWRDAGGDADLYTQLIEQRNKSGQECSPEEQAGEEAGWCPVCSRKTVHMHSDVCMVKECEPRQDFPKTSDA